MASYHGPKWDFRFLDLARHISQWSKDPSTRVGAVLVRPDKSVASVGFNGFPPGVRDTEERLNNRETKLKIVRHAEANCIDFCRDEDKSSYALYLWPPGLVPCTACSSHLIANKVGAVVFAVGGPMLWSSQWTEDNELARVILNEAGIAVFQVDLQG